MRIISTVRSLVVILAAAGMAARAGTISLQPSTLTVDPGQKFSFDVNGSALTDVYAFQFDLVFNPGLVSVLNSLEGSFLSGGGTTIFVPGTIDNTTGTISFTGDSLTTAVAGVSGNGTLATIGFQALAGGTGSVSVSNLILLNSALSPISSTVVGGTVTVSGVPGVPEPATWALLIPGLAFIICKRKRGCSGS